MKKFLIADDEEQARKFLSSLIYDLFPDAEIDFACDGLEALLKIEIDSFDAVFLDIEMPKMNGLEVAQSCSKDNIKIIFTTAYDEYAVKAFEVSALDYVLKPFNKARIAKAITKSEQDKNFTPLKKSTNILAKIAFKVNGSYKVFSYEKISAFLKVDDYVEFYYQEKKYLINETLDSLEKKLPSDLFIRIHRSHMINFNFIEELKLFGEKKFGVLLSDFYQLELSVSRQMVPILKKKMGL